MYSGNLDLSTSDCYFPANKIVNYVESDFELYGENNNRQMVFVPIGRYDVCPEGTYKVALVIAPGQDYHWYRQDDDGYWSHKPGITPVTREDESEDVIVDPQIADRGAYTQFVGYYAVTPWNRYYSSVSEMDFENIFVVDCVNLGNMLFELISYNLTSIKEYLIAYIPLELAIDHSYNYTKTICYENRTHCQFLRKNQTNHFIFTLHRRNKV